MDREDEITDATVVQRQKRRRPSFWVNMGTLVVLAAVILFAQKLSREWITPTLPEEAAENGIVLEDLETDKPFIEAETVEVPHAPESEIKEEVEKILETTPPPRPAPAPKPTSAKQARPSVKKPVKKISPYAKDPYTDGGPMDLDRRENWDRYFLDRPKDGFVKWKVPAGPQRREATAAPLLPTERDRFIPFERE
ncbi:MAG: hypothetical protein HY609_04020 [Deltaproteobacteria bacterium]|nr:hypothetical protein [Deltaproteobacteria bacterium]MBI4224075.1 hypothetical protein [Deltaproteobacteria bacterium]